MDTTVMILICIAFFCGTLLICGIIYFFEARKGIKGDKLINKKNSDIFILSIQKRRSWQLYAQFWQMTDYLLKILPFECTAIVLYFETYAPNTRVKSVSIFAFSIISILLIIISFALKPHEQMRVFRKAYFTIDKLVNLAIIDKNEKISEVQEKRFVKAIEIGESYINRLCDMDDCNFQIDQEEK